VNSGVCLQPIIIKRLGFPAQTRTSTDVVKHYEMISCGIIWSTHEATASVARPRGFFWGVTREPPRSPVASGDKGLVSQSKVKRLNFKERRSALMVAETIIDGLNADPSGMIAMSTNPRVPEEAFKLSTVWFRHPTRIHLELCRHRPSGTCSTYRSAESLIWRARVRKCCWCTELLPFCDGSAEGTLRLQLDRRITM